MIDLWAVDDANLDVYQFRMMCHIARVGVCWKSIRTLAKNCNMSVGKASQTRQWLEDNGYILKAKDGRSGRVGWSICPSFERSQDEQIQQNSSPDEQNVHDVNKTFTTRTKRSPDEHGRSPHEPKTITIRQQPKEVTEDIYIHPLPDEIQELITAIAQTVKTGYGPKTEEDFEATAYALFGWDVQPTAVSGFGEWWKRNGYYSGKPALKSLADEFRNYLDGVTISANGHSENGTHHALKNREIKRVQGEF